MDSEERCRLLTAGSIAKQICDKIKENLSFECSAGIGENKLTARLCCGMNKPHSITIMTHQSIPRVGEETDISKLAGLGGVIGENIKESFGIQMMNKLKDLDPKTLSKILKIKLGFAKKIIGWGHGIHHEPVTERLVPCTVTAGKTFSSKSFVFQLVSQFLNSHLCF